MTAKPKPDRKFFQAAKKQFRAQEQKQDNRQKASPMEDESASGRCKRQTAFSNQKEPGLGEAAAGRGLELSFGGRWLKKQDGLAAPRAGLVITSRGAAAQQWTQ